MRSTVTITDALRDPALLGSIGDLASWSTWLAVLRAAFGLPLDVEQLAAFSAVAGDRSPPSKRVAELWCIAGRRSGKSRIAAALAVHAACLTDARSRLARGEQGFVLVLAPTVSQARVIFDYALGFILASPLLRSQLDGEPTANEIRLRGGVTISVLPASYRSVRGRILLACIADESAFWRDETSALPDIECYRAVMPALATTGGQWIGIGSPYRKIGLMHAKHRDHFGVEGDRVLVVQGESRLFNPTLAAEIIEAAESDDPEAAASEWRAEFRSDLSALLDDAVIDASVDYSRPLELPPQHGTAYFAFADPSGGRHDAFTIAIGHVEIGGTFIADAIRATKPPFDIAGTVSEYVALARSYNCRKIIGDAYAASWVSTAFADCGMAYEQSRQPKSNLYLEAVAPFNQGKIRIPDLPSLLRELRLLERRTHRSGRDSVDHPRGGSDDIANALCGCIAIASSAPKRIRVSVGAHGLFGEQVEIGQERERPRIKIVSVDESGRELSPDEVRTIRRGERRSA